MKKLMRLVLSALCLVLGAEAGTAVELPAGYTAVDYIVAPNGAYIDTGYWPSDKTRVAMDVTVQGAREYWFGAWNVAWNDGAYALGNDNGEVCCGYGFSDMGFRLSRMSSKGESAITQSEDDGGWTRGANFSFDTREEKTIAGTEAVTLTYYGDDWGAGGTGVPVWYSLDGGEAVELKTATDSGTVSWTPTQNGRYEFRHVVTDGTTETAVFIVNGFPGGEANPWEIGEGVTAYVKDRVLYLKGEDVAGYRFTSKADSSKSIFLPAAGFDIGTGRSSAGTFGYYWSATVCSPAWSGYDLNFGSPDSSGSAKVSDNSFSYRLSVRAVRDQL